MPDGVALFALDLASREDLTSLIDRRGLNAAPEDRWDEAPVGWWSRYLRRTMAGKLIFDASEVAKVVAEAKNAKPSDRRPTLNQLFNGGAYSEDLKLDEARANEIRESLLC